MEISFQEWLAGFSLILDVVILFTLFGYLVDKRKDIWQPHFCIGIGLMIYMAGHALRTWVTWFNLFSNPNLMTQEAIVQRFPLVGSMWWLIGSCIAAVGSVKMIKTFAESYMSRYAWLVAITTAVLLPLISLYF